RGEKDESSKILKSIYNKIQMLPFPKKQIQLAFLFRAVLEAGVEISDFYRTVLEDFLKFIQDSLKSMVDLGNSLKEMAISSGLEKMDSEFDEIYESLETAVDILMAAIDNLGLAALHRENETLIDKMIQIISDIENPIFCLKFFPNAMVYLLRLKERWRFENTPVKLLDLVLDTIKTEEDELYLDLFFDFFPELAKNFIEATWLSGDERFLQALEKIVIKINDDHDRENLDNMEILYFVLIALHDLQMLMWNDHFKVEFLQASTTWL
ncbi:MAG: hypothetical protein ACTSRA_13470, partial [Promethearchaeota archaeon]